MQSEFNLIHVIRTFLNWKKQIGLLVLLSGVLTALFSWFFMDNYYKSFATFYPINMAMNDRAALFNKIAPVTADYYGTKEDVNRVLTIAKSTPVAEFLINRFNLAKHYDVNQSKPYWHTKVRKKFDGNYKAIKTENGAVEVSIYDTNADTAAAIIHEAMNKIDEINRESVNDAKKKQIELFSKQIVESKAIVENYGDSLAVLGRQYNIVVRSATDKAEVIDGNDFRGVQLYKQLNSQYKNYTLELSDRISILEQLKVSLESNNASLAFIDKPFVADQKEKPVRSLLVLIAMMVTFFAALIGVLASEQIEDIRKQI